MGTLRFTAEMPHVQAGFEVPPFVIESFPHLRAYSVDAAHPCIRLVPPVEARPGMDLATIAGFWHLAQDAQLNILKSKLAQDVSLETPSLPSAAGDEARRNFLLKDVPGARSNTPPADRPMGAMTPPARPATLSAEGMGIDANPQPVTHGLDLAGKRFSTGLGPGLTY
jgi:hypothetical protein